ncbi:Nuclear poly(A) polymerase 1 [Diplonema papillatum]|nr:Nuclear poly(A) polymerase 1 [Diplonema papillatum]
MDKSLGPSNPLSVESSSEGELVMSKSYEIEIEATKESKEESQLRERTLSWLDDQVKKWVAAEAVKQGYRVDDARSLGGRIYTFGSYRLGVHLSGADIDTLVLVPRHVTREHFFSGFFDQLKQFSTVTELVPVPDATVPLIKMVVSGLSLDLLIACLDVPSIPNNLEITEDEVLKGVDDQTQRSLNGTRVATTMLQCVPNVHTFRSVLRGVKKWANARGVYGNIYGYPGGVAYAILVARVCQLYPNMSPGGVFQRFFKFYKSWWKPDADPSRGVKNNPIYLTKTLDHDKGYGFPVWNRRLNSKNSYDIFPVITPCYPYMNSCYNCTKTTLKVLCKELHRADALFTAAAEKAVDGVVHMDWAALWAQTDFFTLYPTYLHITAGATDVDQGKKWAGFLESRIRRFLVQLELIDDLVVHMLPRAFEVDQPRKDEPGAGKPVVVYNWFVGLNPVKKEKRGSEERKNTPLAPAQAKAISLDTAWLTYMTHVSNSDRFEKDAAMLDPQLHILKRKDLLTETKFALSDADRDTLQKLLLEQRKERKRKRDEQAKAPPPPPAPKGRLASPGVHPAGAAAATPSPLKPFPSPAFRPASAPVSVSQTRSTPSPKRMATPKKVSLTDQLIADTFGY